VILLPEGLIDNDIIINNRPAFSGQKFDMYMVGRGSMIASPA